jgi:hypothetical protein
MIIYNTTTDVEVGAINAVYEDGAAPVSHCETIHTLMRLKLPEQLFEIQPRFPAAYPAVNPEFGGFGDLHDSLEPKN